MSRPTLIFSLALAVAANAAAITDAGPISREHQITSAACGHMLTNVNVWSPDSRWLVYDVRSGDGVFDGTRIECVNVESGEVRRIYEAVNGARCGIVTWHPREPRVVFVLGPERPTAGWSYGATRRRGLLADLRHPGVVMPLEAATYASPFVPGALRGGSHVHVFSPDGAWVSFTYEDEVLARLGSGAAAHDANQRNIGVAVPAGPVTVGRGHPRNHDGGWFSVLVTRTVAHPRPGSDEISRACEEGWIGADGYVRADRMRQKKALAFQGTVTTSDGREHIEVFVADMPDDLTRVGDAGPLEGTATRRPSPPRGTVQRRLTFTGDREHRGLQGPRHWLRSSPDGTQIACLMRDDGGTVQLWLVPTIGGALRQLTHRTGTGVGSAFSWSGNGRHIAAVVDGSVALVNAQSGEVLRLTPRRSGPEEPLAFACVISPDGRSVAYLRTVEHDGARQAQVFVAAIPAEADAPAPWRETATGP